MTESRYHPCLECFNRYDRTYSKECDSTCEYAYAINLRDANIQDLNAIVEKLETELSEEKSRTAKLVARNARLDYDLGYAYQTITKLKGE